MIRTTRVKKILKRTSGLCKSSRYRSLEDLQKDSVELCLTYCGYEECDPGHRFGPNLRNSYVLHFVKSGKGILEIGRRKYNINAGEMFFIPMNQEAWYQADEKEPWTYMWVGFVGYKANECIMNSGFSAKNPVRRVECGEEIYRYIDAMLEAHQLSFADEMKRNGLLMCFFSSLINDFKKQSPGTSIPLPYPGSVYVKHAVEYITQNYDKRIKINELADYIGVNRSYLTCSFKKAMGCSPQVYLVNLRMDKARSLLTKTDIPINAVASAVGYTDQLAFSKIFKQHFGLSPKAYREQGEELIIYDKKGDYPGNI